jgi:predicted ferric reductase
LFFIAAAVGFVAILFTVGSSETAGTLRSPGGVLIAIGRLGGFTGAYLMLVMVLLIARIAPLERSVGQDRLARWHRRVAPWAMGAIAGHVVFITLGYAEAARSGVLVQVWTFVTSYPDVLAAMAGFVLLVMAAVTSIRIARRRMRYETWWFVHLYTYLGLTLAFAHQVATGVTFVDHPIARYLWTIVWCVVAATVVLYRVGLPLVTSLRHQLRVVSVTEENPGVAVIVCRGRRIDRLAVNGGQFFRWRFLTRDLWWYSHPYSLSALPRPPYVRFTVKASGDQSRAVHSLRPGTRVMVEGPYGAFTRHRRSSNQVALFAAGVGVTPIRAILEDLPRSVDVVVIHRAATQRDLVHGQEISELVRRKNGRLHEIVGPPGVVRFDVRAVDDLVPDLRQRDVFVCGPSGFMADVARTARRLGVPSTRIHQEVFEF